MKGFKDLGIEAPPSGFTGDSIKISKLLNKTIIVEAFRIEQSNYPEKGDGKRLTIQLKLDGEQRVFWTSSMYLRSMISQVPEHEFPLQTSIIEKDGHLEFT